MKYTKDIIADISAMYVADNSCVPAICSKYGFPPRSVIAKLSALGIYKKKVYQTKMGTPTVSKSALIEKLSKSLDIDICLMESMEKCTKQLLVILVDKLVTA